MLHGTVDTSASNWIDRSSRVSGPNGPQTKRPLIPLRDVAFHVQPCNLGMPEIPRSGYQIFPSPTER